MTKTIECPNCEGHGSFRRSFSGAYVYEDASYYACDECDGEGVVEVEDDEDDFESSLDFVPVDEDGYTSVYGDPLFHGRFS